MLGYLWYVMNHKSKSEGKETEKGKGKTDEKRVAMEASEVYQLLLSKCKSDAAMNMKGKKGRLPPELLMTLTKEQMESMRHFAEEHDPDSLSNLCRMDEIERECIELRREVDQKMADLERLTEEMDAEKQKFQELVAVQRDTVSELRMDLEAKEKQISELMASHPSSISSSSSSIEEEEEDEVVDSVDVESSLSGKRAFVRSPPSHQSMLSPELSFHQMDAVLNDSDDSNDLEDESKVLEELDITTNGPPVSNPISDPFYICFLCGISGSKSQIQSTNKTDFIESICFCICSLISEH